MRQLSEVEAIDELCSLDASNGWAAAQYRPDVIVLRETLVAAVASLVDRYGTYPLAKSKSSEDFWLLIVRERGGGYSLSERYEASMLNYKVQSDVFNSVTDCARALVNRMFAFHINAIRVQDGSDG